MNQIKFVYALLMHAVLFGSIWVIYFQSRVIGWFEDAAQPPQKYRAPANRLVVFVLDGLQATDFFENGCNNVPHLRQLFLHQGLVGIIRMPAPPIDRRAAHISIFAGFQGDRSASFDSVFNHSTRSYAWSSQILEYFPNLYHIKIDNSIEKGKIRTFKQDEAVFQSLKQCLLNGSQFLDKDDAIIYLVHLQGLQLAGKVESFQENLNYTERDIWKTYHRFEMVFPDHRTAYLLVSHSGKTTKKLRMETPVFLWGSGVSHTKSMPGPSFRALDQVRPLHSFHYIQLTPLMSAMLGIPTPFNNLGTLPSGVLNSSNHYEAYAMWMNSLQLLAQAKNLLRLHNRGLLSGFLPKFWLTLDMMDNFESTCRLLSLQKRFKTLREYSANFMPSLLKCIDYYQVYYQGIMIVATAFGILGWLYYLHCQLESNSTNFPGQTSSICFLLLTIIVLLMSTFIFAFVLLQRIPWIVAYVLLLPAFIWLLVLRIHNSSVKSHISRKELMLPIVLSMCCVLGFNRRHFLGIFYMGFAFYNNRHAFRFGWRNVNFYLWLFLVCGLAGITWCPSSLGSVHRNLLLASIPLTFLRPFAFGIIHRRNILISNGLILTAAFIHIQYKPTGAWIMNVISWSYLCVVFIRQPQNSIELIFNLSTLYTLLCTSYETLVIQMLATELNLGLKLKLKSQAQISEKTISIYILIYGCFSFLAVGNISDVEYFQKSLEYTCFGDHSILLPLITGIKLLLPSFLLLCVMGKNCRSVLNVTVGQKVFNWLLFMCSTMVLLHFIWIRNQRSWHEVSFNVQLILIIQIFPFLVELERSLARFKFGTRNHLELPNCKHISINIL